MKAYLDAIGISVISRSANYFLEVEGQKTPGTSRIVAAQPLTYLDNVWVHVIWVLHWIVKHVVGLCCVVIEIAG